MAEFNEKDLSALLLENTVLRSVEPGIYSVLPDNESGNEYDSQFGFIYDLVAAKYETTGNILVIIGNKS